MIPAVHFSCNHVLGPAKGDEGKVGTLPVFVNSAGVACFWLPTTTELAAINRGEPLCINVAIDLTTSRFPPIALGVPDEMFDFGPKPNAPATVDLATLGNILARLGIVDPRAIEDPEAYDGHETAIAIARLHRELTTAAGS
jgi:hypothetical protein